MLLVSSLFNANARGKFLQPLPTPERRFVAIERFQEWATLGGSSRRDRDGGTFGNHRKWPYWLFHVHQFTNSVGRITQKHDEQQRKLTNKQTTLSRLFTPEVLMKVGQCCCRPREGLRTHLEMRRSITVHIIIIIITNNNNNNKTSRARRQQLQQLKCTQRYPPH